MINPGGSGATGAGNPGSGGGLVATGINLTNNVNAHGSVSVHAVSAAHAATISPVTSANIHGPASRVHPVSLNLTKVATQQAAMHSSSATLVAQPLTSVSGGAIVHPVNLGGGSVVSQTVVGQSSGVVVTGITSSSSAATLNPVSAGQTITLPPGAVPISVASVAGARSLTSLNTGAVSFRPLNANSSQSSTTITETTEEAMSITGHCGSSVGDSGSAGSAADAAHQNSQSEQRLKVEDALNYLDQVKYKFGNQPQVYNDFLDIMKEFKSQTIDTPGVIQRVSHLFRGHPELIVGFNTFLPPGYKIEVSLSALGQAGGYVVTTVQTGNVPGSPGHPPPGPTTTTVMQHNMPPITGRTAPANLIPHPSGGTALNNGRTSPVPATPVNAPSNYEGSTPQFTHSFSSPFVQSAFPSLQSQPVEFNHAINYVNKIKSRFQGQPDKYKQFLEILHTYQKEQRNIKEGLPQSSKHLTEHEVYSQVSKLFENQEDLLQEFGQFLPDATNHQSIRAENHIGVKTNALDPGKKSGKGQREYQLNAKPTPSGGTKRPPMQQNTTAAKKFRLSTFKDVSLDEASKHGSLNEFAFFDKVRQLLKSPEIYENFLRCLILHNDEILTPSELLQLVTPFLSKSPDLYAWFKEFIGLNDSGPIVYESVPAAIAKTEKLSEEQSMEIDFSTCKRLGASYCALPKNHVPAKCSGRTPLCTEVLNDVWVSFPTWSEDSTFITSRKTQFEEYIYRCEDERFELDVVIETNASTIRVLESIAKKMSRMSQEELNDFELDDCLGGSSPTIHQRAVRRLYGDKAPEILDGLKKQPATAVPLVLRRLKAKEEEWREAQKGFNKIWREQIERFYLKSLDHQGITFKQSDVRALRSKALINELETVFEERQEQQSGMEPFDPSLIGPHLQFAHKDISILEDANNLLIHHVRRQSGIQKEDKKKIKQMLKQFIPDIFFHKRLEITEDEADDYSPDEFEGNRSPGDGNLNGSKTAVRKNGSTKKTTGPTKTAQEGGSQGSSGKETETTSTDTSFGPSGSQASEGQDSKRVLAKRDKKLQESEKKAKEAEKDRIKEDFLADEKIDEKDVDIENYKQRMGFISPTDADEAYTLMYGNTCWYVFYRLHFILCERLSKMREKAKQLREEELKDPTEKNSAASILRLRPKHDVDVEYYYPFFLELVRNLLDGNIEASNYEDTLREMFGIHAYVAYTLDKVIANAVRQLQTLVSDETCQKCLEMFHLSQKRGGAGGLCSTMHQRIGSEIAYLKKAEKVCAEDGCVKVVYFKKQSRITFELLESEPQSPSPTNENAKWQAYVERFVQPGGSASEELRRELARRPVFLPRNIRNWKKRRQQTYREEVASTKDSAAEEPVTSQVPSDDRKSPSSEDDIKMETDGDSNQQRNNEKDSTKPVQKGGVIKIEPVDMDLDLMLKSRDGTGGISSDYIIHDNLQCQFNPNSYKMIFVVNSENFIYRKGALKSARQKHRLVSINLSETFGKWHANWIEKNVSEEHITKCEDWLMGISAHTTLTKVISNNDLTTPPYRPFNRYVVVRRGPSFGTK